MRHLLYFNHHGNRPDAKFILVTHFYPDQIDFCLESSSSKDFVFFFNLIKTS
jgi:hypothetical protein